jgi:hypothetical protein
MGERTHAVGQPVHRSGVVLSASEDPNLGRASPSGLQRQDRSSRALDGRRTRWIREEPFDEALGRWQAAELAVRAERDVTVVAVERGAA